MNILWHANAVSIHRAGYYQWPKGMCINPSWSRWVFAHQLRLCVSGRGRIHLSTGWETLVPGACQWLRAGWEYSVESDPEEPLAFLTIRFELRDAGKYPQQ